MPTDILDRYEDFERGRWYSGWTKSILPVASFDAKTTEYTLANIMDSSPKITWWLRLRSEDEAFIELERAANITQISLRSMSMTSSGSLKANPMTAPNVQTFR